MKLHKKIFPEVHLASIFLAVVWIAFTSFIFFKAGNIPLAIGVVIGMTCSYLNVYFDTKYYYEIKHLDEEILRLEKEYQEQVEKIQQTNYEELERHSV